MKKTETATHRQLVKIAHGLLDEHPALADDPDSTEALKARAAALHLSWHYSRQIAAAMDCAIFQRRRSTWTPKCD